MATKTEIRKKFKDILAHMKNEEELLFDFFIKPIQKRRMRMMQMLLDGVQFESIAKQAEEHSEHMQKLLASIQPMEENKNDIKQ